MVVWAVQLHVVPPTLTSSCSLCSDYVPQGESANPMDCTRVLPQLKMLLGVGRVELWRGYL